ncbi:macro domain-containing protein [Thermus antranikianii]|uniref:macro domain-containing protein n=1 Tax=Thermus antranikianii TaxID=88190 RepID=UPI0023551AEF|nr:macro domain-containing protein [Thermus antranikianii]
MGKGVALRFKRAFPENYKAYVQACQRGEVQIGRIFVHDRGVLARPRYILNFPTKKHWRYPRGWNTWRRGSRTWFGSSASLEYAPWPSPWVRATAACPGPRCANASRMP